MKKFGILLLTVAFLSACGNNQTTGNSSSSEAESSSVQSSQSQSTAATSEESSNTQETVQSSTASQADAYSQLTAAYPNAWLPTTVSIDQGKQLGIAADGNDQKLSVLYFALTDAVGLNDAQLNNETPVASYVMESYESAEAAVAAVNPVTDTGGQAVDLGNDITGYQQGGAGSSYLTWQEGNWHLTVRASNIEGQDPVPLAKEVVAYLESAMLPAPDEAGQITLDMNSSGVDANTVAWQKGAVVYTIKHADPLSALEMAVSMN